MIRIAVIGCGRILNAHLQGFLRLREKGVDNFRITALVARREEDGWRFHSPGQGPPPRPPLLGRRSGDPLAAPHTYISDLHDDVDVHVYTDYRRVFDEQTADAILDLTPVYLHHRIGLAALDAGLHILTQKPLAISVRAARALVERAEQKNLVLGTFENARYRDAVRAVRWAFDKGLLGEPQMGIIGSLGGVWSPDRMVADTPWRHDKQLGGGGGSIDIGVHHMNLLRYVFGEVQAVQALARTFEPKRRLHNQAGQVTDTCNVSVDDTYLAAVAFENEAVAQMLWSWAGHGEPLPIERGPAFFGSKGCVQAGRMTLDDGTSDDLLDVFNREADESYTDSIFPQGVRDPFAVLQWDWLKAIGREKTLETAGDEGLRDLAAAYAILESSEAGRSVSLSEMLASSVDGYQREIDAHYGLIS